LRLRTKLGTGVPGSLAGAASRRKV